MTNKTFVELVQSLIKDPTIKEIKITDWIEAGEFSGDDPRPMFEIIKYSNIERYE